MNASEKILSKIEKLLSLAGNNPCEAEAKAALLKAQKLMAEYNVSEESLNGTKVEYILEITNVKACTLMNALSVVIGNSFACRPIISNKYIHFFGYAVNVQAAKTAFEFAAKCMKKGGNKATRDAGIEPGHKGASLIYNAYCSGFFRGVKDSLDEQCVALKIVVPQDVNDELDKRFNPKEARGRKVVYGANAGDALMKGYTEGKSALNKRSIQN